MIELVSGAGPEDEQKRLASLASTELLDSASEERFDRVTRLAQMLFGVSTATVEPARPGRVLAGSLPGRVGY
ncbi:hypothetical protein [Arthrobacter sedimenti]|uniref:hypothetical protein n=1 Tax=Arthrobacter sedimenti TaxID=2694931 RepID=UPI00142171FC|nr:hypothetical protein [Arthrobacter sedimenti]